MKASQRLTILGVLGVLLLFGSAGKNAAAQPVQKERSESTQMNFDEAIRNHEVRVGMTMEQVKQAVGEPVHIKRDKKKERAVWTYPGQLILRSQWRGRRSSDFNVRLIFEKGKLSEIREM